MPVPDFQSVMLPLLRMVADGQAHRQSELIDRLADEFHLTQAERAQRLPSGQSQLFANRVAWARTYLGKAGLVDAPARGAVRITPRGLATLAENPSRVDSKYLAHYPEFVAFKQRSAGNGQVGADDSASAAGTPEEEISRAHAQLQAALADELLARMKTVSPRFFEKLVLDLLVAMGYGGTIEDAARVVGQTGDGGIDGVIDEDRLGLDKIYVQAKRWDNTVGRPVVQAFAGSLQGNRATKGVLITTATFSSEARDFVGRIQTRVVLIDGATLSRLMIEHGVGVASTSTYTVKRVDSDYFIDG